MSKAAGEGKRTRKQLVALLQEARNEIYSQYLSAGGPEEAETNQSLKDMGDLIERLDKALTNERRLTR